MRGLACGVHQGGGDRERTQGRDILRRFEPNHQLSLAFGDDECEGIALRQQVGNNGAEIPCDRPTIEEAA